MMRDFNIKDGHNGDEGSIDSDNGDDIKMYQLAERKVPSFNVQVERKWWGPNYFEFSNLA